MSANMLNINKIIYICIIIFFKMKYMCICMYICTCMHIEYIKNKYGHIYNLVTGKDFLIKKKGLNSYRKENII